MKYLISLFLVMFLTSCSFWVPRKSAYTYLSPGKTTVREVKEKSGEPDNVEFASTQGQSLIYGYCPVSYVKETFGAIFTLGLYATHCNQSYTKMRLIFDKDGTLLQYQDDINARERAAKKAARRSTAMQMMYQDSLQRKQRNDGQGIIQPQKQRCVSRKDFSGQIVTECERN